MILVNTKVILLVGGLGTRLRSVLPSLPKPLAKIGSQPFLGLLVRQLAGQGFRDIVLCTGYLAGEIEREFGDGSNLGVRVEYSRELDPLGTGGAVKHAEPFLEDLPDFLVMNGDSFLEADFAELLRIHRMHGALATIALVSVDNSARYGVVRTDESGRVIEFCEKTGRVCPSLISAGVYVFSRAILSRISVGYSSLEKDVFPRLLTDGIYAVRQAGLFIDIGTPADYAHAQELLGRIASYERVRTKA